MGNQITLGHSNTSGQTPNTLSAGEVAVNTYNQKIWVGNGTGNTLVFNHASYAPASANASESYVTSRGYITDGNTGWNNTYGFVTSSGNTVIGTDTDISLSGAGVVSSLTMTDGVITAHGTRNLTLANLGYTGATNANYINNTNQLTNGSGYVTNTELSNELDALVDAAPGALDTLNELAAAIGDDASYATTVTNALAGKASTGHTHSVTAGQFSQQNFTTTLKNKLDGIPTVSVGASNSTVVQRHSSGYVFANYFNTTPNTITTNVITKIVAESGDDGYMRHADAGSVRSFLNVANGATNVTNNNQLTNGAGYTTNTGTTTASNSQTFTNKGGNISQWTNNSGYITDGNTGWNNTYGFVTSSGVTSVASGTGISGGTITGTGTLTLALGQLPDMTSGWSNGSDEFIVLDNGSQHRKLSSEIFGSNAFTSYSAPPTNNNQLTNGAGYTTNTGTTTASNSQTFTNKGGNISQWTNNSGYTTNTGTTTASNSQTFTNKGGNISQWTNNSGYTTNTGDITNVIAGTGMSGGGTSGSVTLNCSITNNNQLTNGAGYTNNTVANNALPKAGGTMTGDTLVNNYGIGNVGLYSSTKYQAVWSMGNAYKLAANGSTSGSLYGIAWTHTNISGQSKAGLSHQALFMINGTTQTAIGNGIWTQGVITGTSNLVLSGTATWSGGGSANANTAYGWGNHASAGYTSNTGTTTASNSQTFTNKGGNISQWTNNSGYTTNTGTTTASNSQTFTNKGGNISQWTNNSGYTTNVGDITGVTAGTGMTGGGTSGAVTLNCSITNNNQLTNGAGYTTNTGTVSAVSGANGLSGSVTSAGTLSLALGNLADMTQAWVNGTDEFIVLDNGAQRRKLSSEIFGSNAFNSTTIPTNTTQLTNGSGYITSSQSTMSNLFGGASSGVTNQGLSRDVAYKIMNNSNSTVACVTTLNGSSNEYLRYASGGNFSWDTIEWNHIQNVSALLALPA